MRPEALLDHTGALEKTQEICGKYFFEQQDFLTHIIINRVTRAEIKAQHAEV